MSQLSIYADDQPANPQLRVVDPAGITAELDRRGIRFERRSLPEDRSLEALGPIIEDLKQQFGYTTADVVAVTPETPNHATMREKFLAEHTHAEDECRLMLSGGGSFFLHLGDEVLHVEVGAGDLISVPAGTRHWFDMGTRPAFAALRLFSNPEGWVATFTGDAIAARFPAHGEA